ncbi:hypothetical protein CFOL_v3_01072 [Cephalotus follicularis]|uniref:Uncharacterized protein n=1 Tax=Cephalotus follicularis TaxID=3775 RepID=A0A1Q3API0_CEPFO|nr:hypothetical protein CFOL_v3_01072 [Cephalotus follicularis]
MTSFTRATSLPLYNNNNHRMPKHTPIFTTKTQQRNLRRNRTIKVSNSDNSYLHLWKRAIDRERKETDFQIISQKLADNESNSNDDDDDDNVNGAVELEKKSEEFNKILEVSKEERDRVQRMQVIDRADAAISAARALIKEATSAVNQDLNAADFKTETAGTHNGIIFTPHSETSGKSTPGPDFWSWSPPPDSSTGSDNFSNLQMASVFPVSTSPVIEKDQSVDILSLPFESNGTDHNPPLPPFQSLTEVEEVEISKSNVEMPLLQEVHDLGVLSSAHAAEAAHALDKLDELSSQGVNPDGSRWWKETGMERRPDGVICRWTMTRGVSADQVVEWQDKFWEASDEFGYKELGSEKSGRDATGNVWREYWRESMGQERGLAYLEKTADKWGKNGNGDEWREEWWEHYNASGQAEKWAHKWCSIDPNTPVEVGHAHVWHERWGEKYDGHGGSIKYTDKWAERREDDAWTKWGDKWDEHFDPNGHGVKQGETWWEGKYGERWNRTWGEGHNGSGWVHKYGKSSSGEHWDTHAQQDTWYERFPHYGFYHCFDNSVQLREVPNPSEMQ